VRRSVHTDPHDRDRSHEGFFIMPQDHDRLEYPISRRHALGRMLWAGTACTILPIASTRLRLFDRAEAAPTAQTRPNIPVIVKNSTSPYWRTVLSGACRAGQDFDVRVIDLGAQSDADLRAELEIAVRSNPAAIVIAPAGLDLLRPHLDEAATQGMMSDPSEHSRTDVFGFAPDRCKHLGNHCRRNVANH